ncbi:FAD binding domain-containing protein [Pelagibacterium lacus]|uniref:Xanthine dehydrogenase family protein subunit M n=1 Tax=Pelagibacterium lacus TaxID=2282655 RepID=A0A369W5B3_9HYPH|nr:FAD binding domain-containing protein [Pelagibacterium lacus]RDE09045.1 xanthine dehydrogenase family protein subunit M [Pelagibacterium lacus]
MKPSPFTYHAPATPAELADLLGTLEDARVIAGGQSLMPMMNFRFVQPAHLIDLNTVQGLDYVERRGDVLEIGAATRQRFLQRSGEIAQSMPILQEALSHVGHRQTRARGTIGGSLCHFDPSAELVNMAALHDATLTLTSAAGDREVSFAEFGVGYLTTSVQPEEFLSAVRLAVWPRHHGHGFEEFAFRHGDFAICAVSCLMTLDPGGTIERLAIAVSGVTETPVRLTQWEADLRGARPDAETAAALASAAAGIEAMSDAYVSAAYRTHLARVLTRRAFLKAAERAKEKASA